MAGTVFAGMAQNKLDLPAREAMEVYNAKIEAMGDSEKKLSAESAETVAALVTVTSADDFDRLSALGFNVAYPIADMA